MNPGDPITSPVPVSALFSAAREIPKSITRGPSAASSTFEGFRSRCTTPTAWIAVSPSASPAVSASTAPGGNGPCSATACAREGPGTYAVASHGSGPSASASATSAVNIPCTFRAAATSWRNRFRNSGSSASSARITLTATGRPPGERPRNTRPIPPLPSTPVSSYGPTRRGSPGFSPFTIAHPSPPSARASASNSGGHAYHSPLARRRHPQNWEYPQSRLPASVGCNSPNKVARPLAASRCQPSSTVRRASAQR